MMTSSWLDSLPLWLVICFIALITSISIELGYRLGRYRSRQQGHEAEGPIGTVIGATLGLLAFMIAFTFGLAASRFQERREMVVEEANSIGTTFMRAGLLPEAQGKTVRSLLKEYVALRLDVIKSNDIDYTLQRSDELHRQLWREAEAAGRQQGESIAVGLFIDSLNETIDDHAKRVQVGLRNRLPAALWISLMSLTAFAMAGVGYHQGLFKSRRSPINMVLVVSFSIIMALVADLDRPQEGALLVSQEAMIGVQEWIEESQ